MSDATPVSPQTPPPTSTLVVPAAQAKLLKIGDSTTLKVSGRVKSISECYGEDRKGLYDVTLENPEIGDSSEYSPEDLNKPEVADELKNKSAAEMRKRLPKSER